MHHGDPIPGVVLWDTETVTSYQSCILQPSSKQIIKNSYPIPHEVGDSNVTRVGCLSENLN